MRSLVFVAAILLLAAAVSAQTTQAPNAPFSCPSDYVPADSCTHGPCRCAMFKTVSIATNPTTRATTIKIRVTNVCPDPVYYVQFSTTSTSGMTITPTTTMGTYSSGSASLYQWTLSSFDGRTGANATNPPLKWLRFTAVSGPNNQFATPSDNLPWEEFSFTVTNYDPVFPWYYQMHQGLNWDTFGPIDNSLCQCGNCDAGFSQRQIDSCTLGYPNSDTTRSPSVFNENEIMYAFQIEGNQLEMFYSDEHSLTLGVARVIAQSGSSTDFPITPSPAVPTCVSGSDLQFGTTDFDGTHENAGIDGNSPANACINSETMPCGRPMPPTLFLTDLTDSINPRSGDWQYGGTAHLPHKVCGLWKNATKRITGYSTTTKMYSFQMAVPDNYPPNINPSTTGWNLGAGADPVPISVLPTAWVQPYGAEIAWNLDLLNLLPSHDYRFQFIVHDGDQTRTGGDIGQACIIARSACPAGFRNTASNCTECDTDPLPGGNMYTYYCFPTGSVTDPYTLLKIPTSKMEDPLYKNSGGFVPTDGMVDSEGFLVTCNCKRIVKTCPKSCCGVGKCNRATGVCDCTDVPAVQQPDAITCCPLVSTEEICLNDGNYCSGHGICSEGLCICSVGADGQPDWTGPACNISVPKKKTCADLYAPDCETCTAAANANNIFCAWCTGLPLNNPNNTLTGSCTPDTECALNLNPSCTVIFDYKPEPCPDDCSGHGTCNNVTNTQTEPNADGTAPAPWVLVCVCDEGFTGVNCGAEEIAATAYAIGTAAVIGIIIAIIVVIAAVGGGGMAIARNMSLAPTAPAYNNPIYAGKGNQGNNPLHRA